MIYHRSSYQLGYMLYLFDIVSCHLANIHWYTQVLVTSYTYWMPFSKPLMPYSRTWSWDMPQLQSPVLHSRLSPEVDALDGFLSQIPMGSVSAEWQHAVTISKMHKITQSLSLLGWNGIPYFWTRSLIFNYVVWLVDVHASPAFCLNSCSCWLSSSCSCARTCLNYA